MTEPLIRASFFRARRLQGLGYLGQKGKIRNTGRPNEARMADPPDTGHPPNEQTGTRWTGGLKPVTIKLCTGEVCFFANLISVFLPSGDFPFVRPAVIAQSMPCGEPSFGIRKNLFGLADG